LSQKEGDKIHPTIVSRGIQFGFVNNFNWEEIMTINYGDTLCTSDFNKILLVEQVEA